MLLPDSKIQKKVARNCPEYNPVTQCHGVYIPAGLDSLLEVKCRLCTQWDEPKCSQFKYYKEKYT